MNEDSLDKKIGMATKWSLITEIFAKLAMPISNIILARVLAPEVFGVVATINMITSFADMLSDAGFQKYLVQHEFKSEKEKYDNANVAFWTNLMISIFILIAIIIMATPITNIVGSPGLESVIIISCISLPITSFSSIQIALYYRDFDYKTLFINRMVSICIPFIITIPLSLLTRNYWALVIGNLSCNLTNSIILTMKSKWKPKLFYSFTMFKEMISFSIWSLIESIFVWIISWGDVFIIGDVLNKYYIGLYKTSMSTVNSIISIITSSTSSILLTALSRLQNNREEYEKILFKFQRLVALFVFPLGVGIFMYSEFITSILLGNQWKEASNFIGIWGLMSSISIVFSTYCGIVYISKGKPRISVLAQILQLIVLIPSIYISVNYSYSALIYTRSLIRIEGLIVHFCIIYLFFKISPIKMLINVIPAIIGSAAMALIAYYLQKFGVGILENIFTILICCIFYLLVILLFKSSRNEVFSFTKNIIIKFKVIYINKKW